MKEITLKSIGDKIRINRTKRDFMIIEVVKDEFGKRLIRYGYNNKGNVLK